MGGPRWSPHGAPSALALIVSGSGVWINDSISPAKPGLTPSIGVFYSFAWRASQATVVAAARAATTPIAVNTRPPARGTVATITSPQPRVAAASPRPAVANQRAGHRGPPAPPSTASQPSSAHANRHTA